MLYGNTIVAPLRTLGLGGLQVGAVRIHARGEARELGLHDVLVEGAGEVDQVRAEWVGEHDADGEQAVVDDLVRGRG